MFLRVFSRRNLLATMLKVCENPTFVQGLENETIAESEIFETLLELQPKKMEEVFLRCSPLDKIIRRSCNGLLTQTLTDEGICYTFNGLNAHDLLKTVAIHSKYRFSDHDEPGGGWTIDRGYENYSIYYPVHSFNAYNRLAMTFLMLTHIRKTDSSCSKTQGFKISVHSPAEIPRMSNGFISVPTERYVTMIVKPRLVNTSDDLRTYASEIRQCYFNNEKFLRYFKMYSQHNCEMECLSNQTAKACGCVEFYMPRSSDIPICGLASRDCTETVGKTKNLTCNCLPGCISLSYDTELTVVNTYETGSHLKQ
jgi:acid-sensing ion channel, other